LGSYKGEINSTTASRK